MGEIVDRWPVAVGDSIARHAWPARIGRDGTLHVATTDSIWAFELGHRSAEIAARLGVTSVRFAPGQLPSATPAETLPRGPEVTAAHAQEAARLASSIRDENLRKSVQKAISLGLARDAGNRPV
jgi:hypothetical protein